MYVYVREISDSVSYFVCLLFHMWKVASSEFSELFRWKQHEESGESEPEQQSLQPENQNNELKEAKKLMWSVAALKNITC